MAVLRGPGRSGLLRSPVRVAARRPRPRPRRARRRTPRAARRLRARPTDERVRLGVEIVRDLTRAVPAMVVFDDLHWADSESVALFERLAEQGSGPRLLIGTYRPDALHRRHPTAEMLPRLERRHAVTHLHLDRLSTLRGRVVPHGGLRARAVVPRHRRAARTHRRQPVLPRGAARGRAATTIPRRS